MTPVSAPDPITRINAALKGRYGIERLLGEGGMALVYLATDVKHDRRVAVKVLKPELAASVGNDRFLQEIRTTANLRHPHIMPLFDSGEADGFLFYVMPYVEGESLRDRLDRDAQLPVEEAIRLAREVAGALAHAHEQGVVHRDIKPGNIMLEAGHAVVTDFGIASALTVAGGERLTQTGMLVGTPAYMSPEQASGSAEIDARSDLYSLACVVYEMLAGQPPFTARSAPVLLARHVLDPVPPLTTARPGIAPHIARAIEAAMAKTPVDRFGDVTSWARALSTPTEDAGGPPVGSAPRRDRSPATASFEAASARPPAGPPLVGRGAELEELGAKLDAASSGAGTLVLIGGQPGVGKTRLTDEVLSIARGRGMTTFAGHCYEGEGGEPFIPFVEILDEVCRLAPRDILRTALEGRGREVVRLQAELQRVFPDLETPPELPPEQLRRYLSNGMLEFLRALSAAQPIVLFLDDLQWADEATMHLIQHLAPHVPSMPVVVLATHRDTEADIDEPFRKGRANLVRQKQAERLHLKALTRDAVGELLAHLGAPEPPAALVAAVFEATDGNAFFVEEVFEHLAEEGRLLDGDAWRADLDAVELDVPEGVRVVIERRLVRLGDDVATLLGEAAVIGRRFDLDVLEAMAADGDAFVDAVEKAERSGLIAPESGARATHYAFAHDLIRQTLEDGLSLVRRRRLHARIAQAMEATYGDRIDDHAAEMARHLAAGGAAADPDLTIRMHLLAGLEAVATAAAEEAEAYFDTALSILEETHGPEADPDRGKLLYHRGLARRMLAKWPHAEADLMEAFPYLEAAGESDLLARLCREVGFFRVWAGKPEENIEMCGRGLAVVGREPSAARCRLLAMSAWGHSELADYEATDRLNTEAIAMAEALGDDRLLGCEALLTRMFQFEHSQRARDWWEAGERSVALVREVGTPWDLADAFGIALLALPLLGRFEDARRAVAEVVPIARLEGDIGALLHSDSAAFTYEFAAGDLGAARAAGDRILELCEEQDLPWDAVIKPYLAMIELRAGDVDAALRHVEGSFPHELPPAHEGIPHGVRLVVLAHADPDAATEVLEREAERLPEPGSDLAWGTWTRIVSIVEAALVLDRPDIAARPYALLAQLLEMGTVVFWTHGLTERFAAMSAAAAGDVEGAERHFETAAHQAETMPHVPDQAQTRRWRERLLPGTG